MRKLTKLDTLWMGAEVGVSPERVDSLVMAAADVCGLEDTRRTCRAFMWVRKKADPPYNWMPKEISRMICEVVLATAKQEAMLAMHTLVVKTNLQTQ